MDELHKQLLGKSAWYKNWHSEPTVERFHWVAFVLVVVVVGGLVVNSINPFLSGLKSHAASSDPSRVLVVYNSGYTTDDDHDGVQDSLEVAQYYMQKRGIPSANMVGVNPTNDGRSVTFANFKTQVAAPVQAKLVALGEANIDYIVPVYGLPWVLDGYSMDNALAVPKYWSGVSSMQTFLVNPYFEQNPLYTGSGSYDSTGASDKGPFNHTTYKYNSTTPMYLVSRIDGPTDITGGISRVLNLVDQASYGQKYVSKTTGNMTGKLIDAGPYDPNTMTLPSTDTDITSGYFGSYAQGQKNVSYTAKYAEQFGIPWMMLGTQNNGALLYAGYGNYDYWYNQQKEWLPGAVGEDLNSNTFGWNIHDTNSPAWSTQAIGDGITATCGVVGEPYLTYIYHPNVFAYYMMKGLTFGEAATVSNQYFGWMTMCVGDPLYAPYAAKADVHDSAAPVFSASYPKVSHSSNEGYVLESLFDDSVNPEVARVKVDYGVTTSYGQSKEVKAYYRKQRVSLSDLQDGQTYHARVTATDPAGNVTVSPDITFQTNAQTPHGGTAWTIPGQVELSNFDDGGEGIAYHDREPQDVYNYTNPRAGDGVEVEYFDPLALWFVRPGEWTEYTVNVTQAGTYRVDVQGLADSAGAQLHVEVDGQNKTGAMNVATGTWGVASKTGVSLSAGTHVIRVSMDVGVGDNYVGQIDWMKFTLESAGAGDTTPPSVALTSPVGNQTVSGTITLSANASDNVGVAGVQFKVDNVSVGAEDTTAPYSLSWDSSAVFDNDHQITAVARDAAGNVTNSAPVTVFINNSNNQASLQLSTNNLTFAGTTGGSIPAPQTVTLSNPNAGGAENWTAVTNQAWCHVSPASGFLAINGNVNLSLSVDAPSNIGSFNCTLTVSSPNASNSPQTANIVYTVTQVVSHSHLNVSDNNPGGGIGFSGITGGPIPPSQSVTLDNLGTGTSTWSASSNQAWCHVSPTSGTLAANSSTGLTVSVDAPTNTGYFQCQIAVTDPNADNSPQIIYLSYTVSPTPVNPSHLNLSVSSMSFSAVSGDPAPTAKSFTISNSGTGSSSWTATTNQNWCHVSPASEFLASGGQSTLSASVDSPSNVGTFTCTLSINDSNADNSPQSITITYTVVAAPPPAVTPVITSFSVSSKNASSATITWTTNQPTTGIMKYGTSKTNLNLSVADSVSKTTHSVTLNGLNSKSTYYYQISASNPSGTATTIISSFRTKPR